MKKTLIATGTVALVAAGFLVLTGFRHACHRAHDPAQVAAFVTGRVEDALDDVDATEAQRQQILAVKDRMLASGQALHADSAAVHQEFLAQWKAEQPDKARLHALVDQRFEAMRALAHQAVDAGVEVHDVLTPDQRAKLTRKVERHMGE
ncbi:MAG: Spy/CpxP family protein refolding chaperone [Anaeromyxobacter sp.]